MSLAHALERLLCEFSGIAGVSAEKLANGEHVAFRGDELFPTASAIKPFILLALFSSAQTQKLDLSERVELGAGSRTLGSGVLLHLDAGLRPTLADLATLMMMVSDNHATNLLLERIGTERVNQAIRGAGLVRTELRGPIDFARISADQYAFGVSTPNELAGFFARLARGELLDERHTARMLDVLRIQKYIEPLRRELPADPYAREFGEPEPVWVASKTGSLRGVRVDAGLVHTPRASWSIAVMTKDVEDGRVTSDNEGVRLIARASRLVFDAWGSA
jgi:beta-lactamase class A